VHEAVDVSGSPREQEPLSHSSSNEDTRGDTYARHVKAVRSGALERAKGMLRHSTASGENLLKAIEAAATFHDLGKLDPANQAALRKGRGTRLKWDHIDAGVACLSAGQDWMAAWLVRAHHAPGLPQKAEHFTETTDRRLRGRRNDDENSAKHQEQIERTNSLIDQYLEEHEAAIGEHHIDQRRPIHGLTMRLALSCLVDADYADSAFFDTGYHPPVAAEPRWAERLDALCRYVPYLPIGRDRAECARNRSRRAFFEACLNSNISDRIVACEAPVGLGKTTAVSAYLIRWARDEGLRRLIIVAPFTTIITQTAHHVEQALVLPGEQPEHVLVEQHNRADFPHRADRDLAVLWRAPVVLTTAVSFFESLAACEPGSLRKLHAVPGSAIFIDEAHAALPTKLWPQNWLWIRELAEHWGCRIALASGSQVRFWESGDIVDKPVMLPELLPCEQYAAAIKDEQQRVSFQRAADGRVLTVKELIELVNREPGPRLVILNTVQNAAVVAKAMKDSCLDVLHLSTALMPHDRETILERIHRRLLFGEPSDWTLVATSCVEAGLDLSFRCAFRERLAASSIIQVGGRVNRHGEYSAGGGATVYDFALTGERITQLTSASVSAEVLRELLAAGALNRDAPAQAVTTAMREEIKVYGGVSSDLLVKAESERDYPRVKKLGSVINADTRFVVIEPRLVQLLREHKPVSFKTLLEGSVQLWASRVENLGLESLPGRSEVYIWSDVYDPDFLGYMSGVLRNSSFLRDNDAWII